jgi:phage FluMu protein Com
MSADEDPATRVIQRVRRRKHKVAEWLQEHAAEHKMRCEETVGDRGMRVWNIDCDACGTKLSKLGGMWKLETHLQSVKHVNAMSAGEDLTTRVVHPRTRKHKVAEWLQEHAAEHRMRSEEAVGKQGRRVWNIDCDACGTKLSRVGNMSILEAHLHSAKHVNAMSAGKDSTTRSTPAIAERKRRRS